MPQLGIQLIVFGKRSGEDLPGVLHDVKSAGYDGAEIGNPAAQNKPASEVRAMFDDAGLSCAGYHTGYNAFADLDLVARTADHMNEVGVRYLMCSGTAGRDRDGYLRSAGTFNAAGALLAGRGVHLCYHNHNWEFFPLDGSSGGGGGDDERGMDLLVAHTDPAHVKLCVDVYWVACAGLDPAAFIARHADRAVYFHYKDGAFDAQAQQPLSFSELGRGQVDLRAAHAAVVAQNPDWIVTEQDKTERDPAESARISADYARRELGI